MSCLHLVVICGKEGVVCSATCSSESPSLLFMRKEAAQAFEEEDVGPGQRVDLKVQASTLAFSQVQTDIQILG